MSYNIELRHLRYFEALAEELHFRKAAEKLFISQPGLSRQIKILEEEIGVQLLKRNKKNVALTTAGEYFIQETEFILNHLSHAIAQARSIQSGNEGEIRIGFVGSAMQVVIPQLIIKLSQHFPRITTSLDELSNDQQINHLIHDKLDIGFIRKSSVPDGITQKVISAETFSLVLPHDHHIGVENFKSVSQFKNEAFILFERKYSPEYFSIVMSIFEDKGFRPNISHKSVHASTIYRLVENGLGIAIVPSSLTFGFDMNIKFIELDKIRQRTNLYICWKDENRNPALPPLLSLIDQ